MGSSRRLAKIKRAPHNRRRDLPRPIALGFWHAQLIDGIVTGRSRRHKRGANGSRLGAEVVMADTKIAAYGSWSSPITSDMIVASSIGLGEIMLDGADVYWLESRPQEGGRSVLVRRAADGGTADVTPPVPADGAPAFNLRTRVHEYGGGAYLVHAGVVYFSNDADQRLYALRPGTAPMPLTPEPGGAAWTSLCRWRHGCPAQPDDLGPRGSHDERSRTGQHAGRNPPRQRAAAARPPIRARLLCGAPAQP